MAEHLSAPPDPVAPYAAHLWRRKWWILAAVAVAAGVSAWLADRNARTVYQASALLFVKDKSFSSPIERYPMTPVTYETLLFNEDLLRQTAETLEDRTSRVIAPAALRGLIAVRSRTISDTTLGKKFSPILELSAKGGSADGAMSILDAWVTNFVALYGSLFTEEARWRVEAARARHDAGVKRLEELERAYAGVDAQWIANRQMAAYKLNLLAPAAPPNREAIGAAPLPERFAPEIEINAGGPSANGEARGLLGRILELEIDIASGALPGGNAEQRRELGALRDAAGRLKTDIDALREEVVDLAQRRAALSEQIAETKTELQANAENISQLALWLEEPAKDAENVGRSDYEGSDVSVIARPAAAEASAPAPATRNALLAGIGALIFAMLFFVVEKYLRGALAAEAK